MRLFLYNLDDVRVREPSPFICAGIRTGVWYFDPPFFSTCFHNIRDICKSHFKMFSGFQNVLLLLISLIHNHFPVGYSGHPYQGKHKICLHISVVFKKMIEDFLQFCEGLESDQNPQSGVVSTELKEVDYLLICLESQV